MGRRSFFFSKLPTTTTVTRTWSSINSCSNTRDKIAGAVGDDSGAFVVGAVGGSSVNTEEYNGTSWSGGGNNTVAKQNCQCTFGTISDAMLVMGSITSSSDNNVHVEEYNGTAWSNGTNTSTGHRLNNGGGSTSDGFSSGGYNSTANYDICYEWNGSSWSVGGTLPVDWTGHAAGGSGSGDGIIMGGTYAGRSNDSATYNGTSWTNNADSIPNAHSYTSGDHGSTGSYAMLFGGGLNGSASVKTDIWNGTTWSNSDDLTNGRGAGGGSGSGGDAIAISGQSNPSATKTCEVYT